MTQSQDQDNPQSRATSGTRKPSAKKTRAAPAVNEPTTGIRSAPGVEPVDAADSAPQSKIHDFEKRLDRRLKEIANNPNHKPRNPQRVAELDISARAREHAEARAEARRSALEAVVSEPGKQPAVRGISALAALSRDEQDLVSPDAAKKWVSLDAADLQQIVDPERRSKAASLMANIPSEQYQAAMKEHAPAVAQLLSDIREAEKEKAEERQRVSVESLSPARRELLAEQSEREKGVHAAIAAYEEVSAEASIRARGEQWLAVSNLFPEPDERQRYIRSVAENDLADLQALQTPERLGKVASVINANLQHPSYREELERLDVQAVHAVEMLARLEKNREQTAPAEPTVATRQAEPSDTPAPAAPGGTQEATAQQPAATPAASEATVAPQSIAVFDNSHDQPNGTGGAIEPGGATPGSGLSPEPPRVAFQVGTADGAADRINAARDKADKLGLTVDIERHAFEGQAADAIVDKLGDKLEPVAREAALNGENESAAKREFVRAVRVSLGVPSQEDPAEYAKWRTDYEARQQAPALTDAAPAVPTTVPEQGAQPRAPADREARAAAIHAELHERYYVKRPKLGVNNVPIGPTEYRFKGDITRVAFSDALVRISTDNSQPSVAKSMVDLAEAKGWSVMKVTGAEDFKRAVWLHASARGIKAIGFEPQLADLELLEKTREALRTNRIEATSEQPAAPAGTAKGASGRGGGAQKVVMTTLDTVMRDTGVPPKLRQQVVDLASKKLETLEKSGLQVNVKKRDKTPALLKAPAVAQPAAAPKRERDMAPER